MINPIHQIARLITEHPDVINHNILLESLENKIKKLLTKLSNQLPHGINIDEITQFATQQRFKELEISRWIAKQVAFNPNLRVDWQSLIDYIAHLKFRDNNKYKTLLKKRIQEVIKDAEEWHSQSQDNNEVMINDEPIIVEFPNGYRIVKLTIKEHCKVEGELMNNCVKDYDPKESDLYSLRSPDGKPKVTIQVLKDGRINELKGRQNKPPVTKYADLVIPWVNSILKEPDRLFDKPSINFTEKGLKDYLGSLNDEGLLIKFAKSKDANIRHMVVKNPNVPINVLRALSKDEESYIRIEVTNNSNTPIDILRLLSKDDNRYVRHGVANNSNTPIDILRLLSKDDHYNARQGVAGNPNTPIDILRSLSKDNNKYVRISVSENSNAPPDALRLLSKDHVPIIRSWVARNLNTPPDVLRLLSKDHVRNIRYWAARNPNIPLNILKSLSKDDYIRSGVASNPNTPLNILELLSKDESDDVRSWVAWNPNTPPNILRILARDRSEIVRKDAVKNLKQRE